MKELKNVTMKTPIAESELILNSDGSIYHLHLRPEHIAPIIITVGDPDRVPMVSKYFDNIRVQKKKREFCSHIGRIGKQDVMVISTGMGTDNIDILFNELDALVNIDLTTRCVKEKLTSLYLIRIGTSGALQKDIPVDSFLASSYALGLDGLLPFYDFQPNDNETTIHKAFSQYFPSVHTYVAQASDTLLQTVGKDLQQGITATCAGFYAPQGRTLRLQPKFTNLLNHLQEFRSGTNRITNFEMETAGIYGLARLLGHHAISMNAILASRSGKMFSRQPKKTVDKLIQLVLGRIENLNINW